MSVLLDADAFSKQTLGLRATKSFTAVTNGSQAAFTITGVVAITGIIGEVHTAPMDGTTTSINLTHDPTIGSAVDLCAATVVTSDVVGTIYGIQTWVTGLLVSNATTAPGEAYSPLPANKLCLTAGQIFFKGTAADAGDTRWSIFWVPVTVGATLVAA